jgi:hypothetical protein
MAQLFLRGLQGGPAIADLDADAVAHEVQVLVESAEFGIGGLPATQGLVPLQGQTQLETGPGLLAADVGVRPIPLAAGDAERQVQVRQGRVIGEAPVDLDLVAHQPDAA